MSFEQLAIAKNFDAGFSIKPDKNMYKIYDNEDFFCDFCFEFDGKRRVRFLSEDLSGPKIAKKISAALNSYKQYIHINVNLSKLHIDLIFDPKKIKLSTLVEAIENTGVSIIPDASNQNSRRHDLMRIGMAAFCFLNIMLFSSAEYLAGETPMAPQFVRYFHLIQLALSIPVVFYCAYPVLKNSLINIKKGRIVIDQPIAIAILAAFTFSAFNVLYEIPVIYFDSVAAVTFFMISARFFQKNYLERSIKRAKAFDDISNLFVKTKNNGEVKFLSISKVAKGTNFLVSENDSIPVDCTLESEKALISLEQINGEPNIFEKTKGDLIKSGSTLKSQDALMISLEKGAESYISKIRKNTQNLLSSRSTTIIWTDKIASAFFSVVILLSIACFYVYSENTVEAFSNSIAMLLVACPCSFAIAVPLAYSKAIATGIKNQVAFKSLNSIDKLSRVSKFIFDKTGTLTMGKPEVVNMRLDPQVIKQQELVELFNTLAPAANHHSVSATLDYLKKSHTTKSKINELHITNVQVITGKGIQGFLNNKKIKVGSSEFTGTVGEDNFNLFFTIDGSEAAAFQIEDALHQDSKDIISDLKKSGHDLLILTGDKKAPSLKIASELDLEPSHVNYEHTPDDKQELISNLSSGDSVAMIGDGMNDALAVGKSSVGINVSNSSNFLKETSDISLLRPGIKGVADALLISNQTKTSLYAAFTFAGLYNVAGVTLSFMGIISPLIAAITMPINSVVVSYLSVIFIKGGK